METHLGSRETTCPAPASKAALTSFSLGGQLSSPTGLTLPSVSYTRRRPLPLPAHGRAGGTAAPGNRTPRPPPDRVRSPPDTRSSPRCPGLLLPARGPDDSAPSQTWDRTARTLATHSPPLSVAAAAAAETPGCAAASRMAPQVCGSDPQPLGTPPGLPPIGPTCREPDPGCRRRAPRPGLGRRPA